jgi:hypothetical protein
MLSYLRHRVSAGMGKAFHNRNSAALMVAVRLPFMLKHQETSEPETSEVIRVAQQMYERDRAEKERQSSLMAAAEEVGIPSEYLTKATAHLKARQIHSTPLTSVQAQRARKPALLALALALAVGILLLFSITYIRSESRSPAVAILESPPPVLPQPAGPSLAPQAAPPRPPSVDGG